MGRRQEHESDWPPQDPFSLKIHVENSQRALPVAKQQVRAAVRALAEHLELPHHEVSIYFVSTKAITELHAEFFDDPTPTDCITFPLDEEHLGELFLCPATAVEYGRKHKLDAHEELTLYLVHGILHCIGYDDLTPKERRAMRKKEKSCMQFLKAHRLTLRRP